MIFREAKVSDAFGITKVQIDTWKTTYHGIITDKYLQSLSYEEKEPRWREQIQKKDKKTISYVAEADNQEIVGFALASLEKSNPYIALLQPDKYIGELIAIYVLKKFQFKKIGTELFRLVAKFLLSHGVRSILVWVLKGNPSYEFYEKLGGLYIGDQSIEIGGVKYIEKAFGWGDLTKILLE